MLSLQPTEDEKQRGRITGGKTLETMTGYIREHLQDVSLSDIAALLHFSAPYTSRLIRKKTGYTFQMLLLILRMEEICDSIPTHSQRHAELITALRALFQFVLYIVFRLFTQECCPARHKLP